MTSSDPRAALLREPPDPAATDLQGGTPTVYPVTVEVPVVNVAHSDLGGWRIDKRVTERTETVDLSMARDVVQVERRPVQRWLADGETAEPRQEGDDLVILVVEEVAVVERRLRVTEEIVIHRRREVEDRTQPVALRSEAVSVQRLAPDGGPHRPNSPTVPRSTPMTQTVIAVFDNSQQAERARGELVGAGFSADEITIQTQPQTETSGTATHRTAGEEGGITGFFRRLFGFNEDDADVSMYSEAVRRGSCVLSVHTSNDDEQARAESILQGCGAIDIDERASQWRSEGWNPGGVTASGGAAGMQGDLQHGLNTSIDEGRRADVGRTETSGQKIPVVQEEMQVGKRQIQRGGVRVYSRVSERPVEESVQLREERAHVERRPANRAATEADIAAMKDTSVEVRESAEEAVVSKQARVVEEVEVGKDVSQRTEKVRGTVKKTDVDVERIGGEQQHAAAAGSRRDTSSSVDPDATTPRDDSVVDRAKAAAERGKDKISGGADRSRTPRK
jgi:uncharacterized protein (TIGR02271 family)